MKIKGKFCNLITLKPEDYKKLYKLRYKVNKLKIVNDIPKDPIYQKRFIEDQIKKKNYFFGIYSNNNFIGTISLYNFSKSKYAEIGRMVCLNNNLEIIEAFLMTINYAFSKLNLNSIIAKTASNNKKSIKILKYFNFKKLSKNRYEGFWANQYHDFLCVVRD